MVAGLLGAALIYGDGAITPAISVLSALEGLDIGSIASALRGTGRGRHSGGMFAAQPLGTSRIGAAFGPIMLVWFVVIGALGLWSIVHAPRVLLANAWLGTDPHQTERH